MIRQIRHIGPRDHRKQQSVEEFMVASVAETCLVMSAWLDLAFKIEQTVSRDAWWLSYPGGNTCRTIIKTVTFYVHDPHSPSRHSVAAREIFAVECQLSPPQLQQVPVAMTTARRRQHTDALWMLVILLT